VQVSYSNALHSKIRGRGPYFLGPLARVNLNFNSLGAEVASLARQTSIPWPNSNPYTSIVARALEVLYSIDEALRIIALYEPPPAPAASFEPRPGLGRAVTEAPRGSLYHAYEADGHGRQVAVRDHHAGCGAVHRGEHEIWKILKTLAWPRLWTTVHTP
jgi:sulfhydrogenase subunit alpha